MPTTTVDAINEKVKKESAFIGKLIDEIEKGRAAMMHVAPLTAMLDKDEMNNWPQPSLALGELPLGKFSKARGVFAAVRVWSAP